MILNEYRHKKQEVRFISKYTFLFDDIVELLDS